MWQNGVYLLNGNGEFSDKYSTMPTASIGLVGKIVQYTGTTTVNYINGYFYKGIATNMPSVATIGIGTSIGITEATVTKSTFETLITESGEYIFEFRESIANAVIGESTGITSASVVKATFEDLITESGAYDFVFTDSLISASIGESTGITSATVDKSTFEEQIDETSTNSFVYNASSASASIGESVGITEATVNKATFESEITVSGEYDFVFDGTDWKLGEDTVTLADYGLDITGTPQLNDTITVTYVAEKWTLSDVEVDLADYGITFEGTPADTDTIVITYTQSKWELDSTVVDLEDYGITYVDVPADGDIITVDYTSDNWYLEDEIVDIASYGIVVTGTPNYEDTVVITYASAYTEYSWSNINVQAGSAEQVALLSITTAPSGSFAVGSKYYNSSTKKIVTAVTADTWTGATSADPVFNVIYIYDSGYYIWDGDNLVTTDLDNIVRGVEVDGVSVVDSNKVAQIPVASASVLGVVKVDGSSITITDGVISADVGSLANVMYFAPTGAGTEDGSSWENAKAFTPANYTAMTSGNVALLKYGTYGISDNITLTSDKQILGGFIGIDLLRERCSVVRSDNVQGVDGVTVFNTYATIITGAVVGENIVYGDFSGTNIYIDNVVFKGNKISGGENNNTTFTPIVKNCIFSNYEGDVLGTCYHFNFDNIYILNSKGTGICLYSESYLTNSKIFNCSSGWGPVPLDIYRGTAINCDVMQSGNSVGGAVRFYGDADAKIYDSRIVGCACTAINKTNQTGADRIVNCTIEKCTSVEFVAIKGSDTASIGTVVKDCKETDTAPTSKFLEVIGGVQYQFGTLNDLTISSVQVSQTKSTIYFTTSASFTAFTATGIPRLDAVTVVAEKSYKIEIENGIMEVKEII